MAASKHGATIEAFHENQVMQAAGFHSGNEHDEKGFSKEQVTTLKNNLLDYVARSNACFNNDEPELDCSEKRGIATKILEASPGQFLSRFGKFLKRKHLEYFHHLKDQVGSYEVDFYLQNLQLEDEDSSDEVCEVMTMKNQILDHVAHSKACFKNEQIGEPDLSVSEKREIAAKILEANPGQFLSRFGKFVKKEQLKYFENLQPHADSYELDFYLKLAKKMHSSDSKKVGVKNRRYAALKKLIHDGSYFSETEMRRRNPLLYEQLVGQHLTDEEQDEINKMDMSSMTLLGLLLDHMDRDAARARQLEQLEYEQSVMEESDDDSSEDEEGKKEEKSEEEKEVLRREFISHMYKDFLEGRDKDFDYGSVDKNPEYDSLDVQQQDAEDKYFDSETPTSQPGTPSRKTSSEDELDTYMKSLLTPTGQPHGDAAVEKLHEKAESVSAVFCKNDHGDKKQEDDEVYSPHLRRSHPHAKSPSHEKKPVIQPGDEEYSPYVPRSHPPHPKSPSHDKKHFQETAEVKKSPVHEKKHFPVAVETKKSPAHEKKHFTKNGSEEAIPHHLGKKHFPEATTEGKFY